MSPELRSGDYIFKPSGTQWVVVAVFDTEGIDGLKDGTHVFAVRPIKAAYFDDIIYDLFPADTLGWTTQSVFDHGDVYQLADEDFAVHGEAGFFASLRREDGSTVVTQRWRLAFNLMAGVDISPEAEWRQAAAGEV
jgi:hypothetical protein